MNWQHEVIEPEEGGESIEYDRLDFGTTWVDIVYLRDGRFFVETTDGFITKSLNDDPEQTVGFVGFADSLDAAKQLAQQWMMGRIGKLLKAAGAEGVWMVRGAYHAMLAYSEATDNIILPGPPLQLSPPHELIVLARFPAGDGREPGIEFIG